MNVSATLLFAVFLGAALTSHSIGPHKLLTDVQMRRLAIAGANMSAPRWRHLRGFEIDREPGSPYDRHYVGYEALWNPTMPGSAHVGFYVIDPRTGDMWDGVSECGEITSPEIRRLQRSYRKQLALSAREYSNVKRRGPMCDQR